MKEERLVAVQETRLGWMDLDHRETRSPLLPHAGLLRKGEVPGECCASSAVIRAMEGEDWQKELDWISQRSRSLVPMAHWKRRICSVLYGKLFMINEIKHASMGSLAQSVITAATYAAPSKSSLKGLICEYEEELLHTGMRSFPTPPFPFRTSF